MENKLVEEGKISALASYFLECLAYNVTNDAFRHSTYVTDLQAVLAQIYNATPCRTARRDEFVQGQCPDVAVQWRPVLEHRRREEVR